MQIASNILRHYLRDVYFFCGTPCGGKTTIAKAFAQKHGAQYLSEFELYGEMDKIFEPAYQPACCAEPLDREAFYHRDYKEWAQWGDDVTAEVVPLMVMELVKRSASGPVAVDLPFSVQTAIELAAPGHLVFLVTTPEIVVRDYCNRPDHTHHLDEILQLRDPAKALANFHRTLGYITQRTLDDLNQHSLHYIMRDDTSTVEHTLALVEQYFGI